MKHLYRTQICTYNRNSDTKEPSKKDEHAHVYRYASAYTEYGCDCQTNRERIFST